MQVEESAWVKEYSNITNIKRDSTPLGTIFFGKSFVSKNIEDLCNFNNEAKKQFEKVDQKDFDIL